MQNKGLMYVLYAIVIIAIVYLVYVTQGFGIWTNAGAKIDSNSYQAIFMDNNQVYFGKISSMDNKQVIMEDIYYLQVQQVQPKPEEESQGKLTLVKLGNEIHGPEDKMAINSEHMMFWENLREDGKVVQAIKQYQSEGPATTSSSNSQIETEDSSTPASSDDE